MPYTRAWAWQKALVRRKLAALAAGEEPADELLVLQHTPVYTLGTGSTVDNLRFSADAPPPFGAELHRTERGGEVTYHGPGQLVLYPILNLRYECCHSVKTVMPLPLNPVGMQEPSNGSALVHALFRGCHHQSISITRPSRCDAMQAVCVFIAVSTELHSFVCTGERIPGLTGTWCAGHKVAAQGVRATRWVSYHGVALNVDPDLAHFSAIVPCGIADRPVGSVATLLAAQGPGACCVSPQSAHHAEEAAASTPRAKNAALVYTARGAMLHAFQQVFCVDLVPQDGMTILAPSNRAHAVEALLDDIVLTHGDGAM